jgi:Na+-driven multidrug efflux pump
MKEMYTPMTTAHKSRVLDMTRGDPFRLVLQFSLPLFCSNLLQQVYNLTDTALAGHLLGSAALAEIGATAALYGLIMNFAFGMNNGLALTVSRCFGAGEQEGIRRAVGWMVTLSAAVSLVLTTVSLLGRGALLQVLQVPAEVWDGAAAYLTVILLGIPLTMLYNMEAALLRAVGNSVTPLLFLLFSSVLNVGLDAAFMGPLGMGVRGAAVATVLAQGISAVLGAAYLVRSYPELHFAPRISKSLPAARS